MKACGFLQRAWKKRKRCIKPLGQEEKNKIRPYPLVFCPVSCTTLPVFIHSCAITATVFVCPMTQRDINIISMVYEYEGCAVEHIRKVFFQGAKNRSIPCYRRLSYLIKQGYLRSLLLPALNKHFLTPGARARSILTFLLKGSEMKWIRIESPMLILHKL